MRYAWCFVSSGQKPNQHNDHGSNTPSQSSRRRWGLLTSVAVVGMLAIGSAAYGPAKANEIQELRKMIDLQQKQLKGQKNKLEEQEKALKAQQKRLKALEERQKKTAAYASSRRGPEVRFIRPPHGNAFAVPGYGALYVPRPKDDLKVIKAQSAPQPKPAGPVGKSSTVQRRPQVSIIPERGGVLTRRGTLVIEPSLEFSHTDVNRFSFAGVEIIDTVLIGVIEATRANRDVLTAAAGFRYGVTDRLELELKVPYLYRKDETTTQDVAPGPLTFMRSIDGSGLGDIELGVHYQVNNGERGWPFIVANLRVKTPSGTGPFDVSRDSNGIETELATGTGFWSIEPSVTFLYPTDPAVFFGSIGYLHTFAKSIDKTVGGAVIGRVEPGYAIRIAFGVGVALNEAASISLGYQHDFIRGTRTEINGGFNKSPGLDVGQLNVGLNYQFSPRVSVNVNVGVGVTNDSPDVRLLVRVPIALQLFNKKK